MLPKNLGPYYIALKCGQCLSISRNDFHKSRNVTYSRKNDQFGLLGTGACTVLSFKELINQSITLCRKL